MLDLCLIFENNIHLKGCIVVGQHALVGSLLICHYFMYIHH